MTGSVPIRPGRASDVDALALLVARAFGPLSLSHWLVPDHADGRLAAMAGQFRLIIASAINHGDVYVAADVAGVAVWFPPGPLPDIPGYDAELAAVCGPHTQRFVELDEEIHKAHPAMPAHAYLAFLAVQRSDQNRGIGSALLGLHHRRLDADGTPAYLDASGLDSRRLYMRTGYADHAEPYGPAGRADLYPMWRDPR
jgi:ribosomal protein S18 acetylase RimI-like enzyme